jgi:hypothetical protein
VEGFEGVMRTLMGTCVCMCTRGHVGMLASEEARHQSRFDYILFIFPFLHYTPIHATVVAFFFLLERLVKILVVVSFSCFELEMGTFKAFVIANLTS